jgi:hypothetical protein
VITSSPASASHLKAELHVGYVWLMSSVAALGLAFDFRPFPKRTNPARAICTTPFSMTSAITIFAQIVEDGFTPNTVEKETRQLGAHSTPTDFSFLKSSSEKPSPVTTSSRLSVLVE